MERCLFVSCVAAFRWQIRRCSPSAAGDLLLSVSRNDLQLGSNHIFSVLFQVPRAVHDGFQKLFNTLPEEQCM